MSQSSQNDSPIDAQLAAPPATAVEEPSYQPASGGKEIVQNRGAVLAVLFLVTGALGLPLLWMNKKFSSAERIFWAIVVTAYTLLLIAITVWIVQWAWSQVFP